MNYCGYCGRRATAEHEPERRRTTRKDLPAVNEIRAVFHRLWTRQVGRDEYSERDWRELRDLLFRRFNVEL